MRDAAAALIRHALRSGATHVATAVGRALETQPQYVAGYRGYAAGTRALVLGRALRGRTLAPAEAAQSRWRNLLDSVRRIQSDPLPHAPVHGAVGDTRFTCTADDEGFVRHWVDLPAPLAAGAWHPVALTLDADALPAVQAKSKATARDTATLSVAGETAAPTDGAAGPHGEWAVASVLAPATTARFGIVSDLDDTVLQSEVGSLLRAARLLLLENARTRLPFPGVAALYRALAAGASGTEDNPIFYVSSSPWNLYDVVADFLDVQGIPAGPLLLRDWDLVPGLGSSHAHKRAVIDELFAAYPALPFVLVGDSGQADPEIYRELVRAHGARVLAVYIRSVNPAPERVAAVRALAAEVEAAGSMLVLADDSRAMATHAAAQGWIAAEAAASVMATTAADAARPTAEEVAARGGGAVGP